MLEGSREQHQRLFSREHETAHDMIYTCWSDKQGEIYG